MNIPKVGISNIRTIHKIYKLSGSFKFIQISVTNHKTHPNK